MTWTFLAFQTWPAGDPYESDLLALAGLRENSGSENGAGNPSLALEAPVALGGKDA